MYSQERFFFSICRLPLCLNDGVLNPTKDFFGEIPLVSMPKLPGSVQKVLSCACKLKHILCSPPPDSKYRVLCWDPSSICSRLLCRGRDKNRVSFLYTQPSSLTSSTCWRLLSLPQCVLMAFYDQVDVGMWTYMWSLNSIPLVAVSVLRPVTMRLSPLQIGV